VAAASKNPAAAAAKKFSFFADLRGSGVWSDQRRPGFARAQPV